MYQWNPWHGCTKISEGCRNCYVYQQDAQFHKNAKIVHIVSTKFEAPIAKDRSANYKIPSGSIIATCMTSDFFIEEADAWRPLAWSIIKERSDCLFNIITKRVDRIIKCLPEDWGNGYPNVILNATAENQAMANQRIPIFLGVPAQHKGIVVAPILGKVDLTPFLGYKEIKMISVGGESAVNARPCDYNWVLDLKRQADENNINFRFHQTGTYLIKNNRMYKIPMELEKEQAAKANLNTEVVTITWN